MSGEEVFAKKKKKEEKKNYGRIVPKVERGVIFLRNTKFFVNESDSVDKKLTHTSQKRELNSQCQFCK